MSITSSDSLGNQKGPAQILLALRRKFRFRKRCFVWVSAFGGMQHQKGRAPLMERDLFQKLSAVKVHDQIQRFLAPAATRPGDYVYFFTAPSKALLKHTVRALSPKIFFKI